MTSVALKNFNKKDVTEFKPLQKKDSNTCLLVFGFLRLFIETQFSCIIPSPIKFICCDFYGYTFNESEIFQSNGDRQALYELLSSQLESFDTKLIFKSSKHGCTDKSFYNHCKGKSPTLVLIESGFGNVFGGYTTVPWEICDKSKRHARYSDEHSFLFVIKVGNENDSETKTNPRIFPIKKSDVMKALYMYPLGTEYMFHFGSAAGIAIVNKFSKHSNNFCYGKGWTYDEIEHGYELCGKGNHMYKEKYDKDPFCAKKIEVFHVIKCQKRFILMEIPVKKQKIEWVKNKLKGLSFTLKKFRKN